MACTLFVSADEGFSAPGTDDPFRAESLRRCGLPSVIVNRYGEERCAHHASCAHGVAMDTPCRQCHMLAEAVLSGNGVIDSSVTIVTDDDL